MRGEGKLGRIIKRKEVRTRLVVFTNRQYKRDNGRLSLNKSCSDSNNTPSRCFIDWWRKNLGSLPGLFFPQFQFALKNGGSLLESRQKL